MVVVVVEREKERETERERERARARERQRDTDGGTHTHTLPSLAVEGAAVLYNTHNTLVVMAPPRPLPLNSTSTNFLNTLIAVEACGVRGRVHMRRHAET